MSNEYLWLKDQFLKTRGKPLCIDGKRIIQMDRIEIPERVLVHVKFLGERIYLENAAVIAVQKPDRIYLSDGSTASAVAIWDEPDLPRQVRHVVESQNRCLEIYNKYRNRHSDDFITEDHFTGDAGMHVVEVARNVRRYECSNGIGPFSLDDLVFELRWEPCGAGTGRPDDDVE